MKKLAGTILMVLIILGTALFVITLLLFPIVVSVVSENWYWLFWYCVIIPSLSVFGLAQRMSNGNTAEPQQTKS